MPRPETEPKLSVIITNWNYAAYLAAAIDSVLGQTRPVHECIVVDDGSTDGSRKILATYGSRIRPVLTRNGGQAAACNAGFALSSGDLILFLDADDALKPEAIETIATAWNPDLAAVCYSLELIDRAGAPSGIYPAFADDIDQRVRLMEGGTFTFMPTSGNAFARRVIDLACPLPEQRWRISADAYLLRVAAFCGRILPLRQSLGYYRIHEANNYYRVGAAKLWTDRRGATDIADLARHFATWERLPGAAARLDRERLRLQMAALHWRVALHRTGERSAAVGGELRRLASRLVRSRAPLWPRLALAAAAVLASGLWRLGPLLDWLGDPHERPAIVVAALALLGRKRLERYLFDAHTPRWRTPTPLETLVRPDNDVGGEQCLGFGWSRDHRSGPPRSLGDRVSCTIVLAPSPSPLEIEIGVTPNAGWRDREIVVEATVDNALLTTSPIRGTGVITVPLPGNTANFGATVEVELSLRPTKGRALAERLGDWFAPPPNLSLDSIFVRTTATGLDAAAAIDGLERPFADLCGGAMGGWSRNVDGAAELIAAAASIAFTTSGQSADLLVALGVGANQPAGWMRIVSAGMEIFSGAWGSATRLWLRVPVFVRDGYVTHRLDFAFATDDVFETARPAFTSISFRAETTDPTRHGLSRKRPMPVNPGQQLTFNADDLSLYCLAEDFRVDNFGMATLTNGAGDIDVMLPVGIAALNAKFHLEPALPAPDGFMHLVTVSAGADLLCRVALAGEAEVDVPLGAVLRRGPGAVTLTLRSLYLYQGDDPSDSAGYNVTQSAPVRLRSIGFSGACTADRRPSRLPGRTGGQVEKLLAEAAAVLDAGDSVDLPRIATLRSDLIAALQTLDLRAMLSLLASPGSIPALTRIGSAAGPLTAGEPALPLLRAAQSRRQVPADRLDAVREILMAMLALPASAVPYLANLDTLPEPLLWYLPELAAYLGADPLRLDSDTEPGYAPFVLALIDTIDRLIAGEPPGAPHRTLAIEVLKALRPQYLLFGEGSCRDPMRALARSIERHLVMEGYLLAHAFPPDAPKHRLRVGILLRALTPSPEAWNVKAMLNGLDRGSFEPVLIVSDPPAAASADWDPSLEILIVGGLTVGEAVDAIRATGLDIFLLGSFFIGFERFAAIVAHRLAPLQLLTAATAPVTLGFSSFDGVLTSTLIDPDGAADDYTEPLIAIDQPVQCFSIFGVAAPDAGESPSLARRRLGLPLDTVLFVSGAMNRKIGRGLMEAWASCLAAVPASCLVLYPYATNWQLDFAAGAFEAWARSVLADKRVDASRLIVLGGLGPLEVRRLLRAGDVYLDSFPYAGATTVTEALDQSLPVVSLRGRHQRGRQGAGWLKAFGLDDDIAATVEAYIGRAVALGTDRALRRERRGRIADRTRLVAPHRDLIAFGASFSKVLIATATAHGIALSAQPTAPAASQSSPYRYLFHHMPKTAGTSCRIVFRRWFEIKSDYREGWATSGFAAPLNLDELTPNDLLMGHFEVPELRLRCRYPEVCSSPDWRLFSIVRDPLELALSNYFFEHARRVNDPSFTPTTLGAHLRQEKLAFPLHFDCHAGNWREAIDRYWFIGTVERFEESLAWLAGAFGQAMPEIPVVNDTPRPVEPDPEDVEVFLRLNALDYEIYDEIRHRLARQLGR